MPKNALKKSLGEKLTLETCPVWIAAFEGISHVYHCAGYISLAQRDAKKLLEINEKGSAYLVDLCLSHSVKKLVYVSSIAALGNDPSLSVIDENTPWDNNTDKNPYAYSKYGGEMEVWRANARRD